MTGTDALFGQTSDSRIGFWLRRVLALVAGNLGIHFLPQGIIFWGARPRRRSRPQSPFSSRKTSRWC